ncbi:hypothetical protein [Halostella sp. PRR32]|uniref:hypothetical protein n=1 Tax=Halostella sp. PRR32 TaxID=3098147 RepID=UPI002B1E3414|nr:hypothetical protein [Halostella sp. PRR32]
MSFDAVAHATGAEFRPVSVRIAVAVLAGFGAAAIANMLMSVLPEGEVPPRVTLIALWPGVPRNAVPAATHTVQYLGGIAAAVGIELVLVAIDGVRTTHVLFLGWVSVSRLAVAFLAAAAIWVLFVTLALPQVGPDLLSEYDRRERGIRRDWSVSALVYAAAVSALVPALYVLLPV